MLETEGVKPWRLLISDYRRTRARFAGLTPSGAPGAKRLLALVDAIATYQRHEATYRDHTWLGPELFRSEWRGEDSNWQRIAQVGHWLLGLHEDIGEGTMPRGLLTYLSRDPNPDQLMEMVEPIDQALVEFNIAAAQTARALDMDVAVRFLQPGELVDQALAEQIRMAAGCLDRMESIHDMARLNGQSDDCEVEGLQDVLDTAYRWTEGENALIDAYDQAWFEGLWERALKERPELRSFDGAADDQVTQSFQELDLRILAHNRARLAQSHWERLPRNQGGGQLAVLRRQFELRHRHLPIRQFLERAENPIQAIKPVFMMSPLSIAAYLSPGGIEFDLVVFDEASQVKPVDALGAVMRGSQVVVVGDSQQLPPTPFFETAAQVEEYSEEDTTGDIESILGLFAAQNAPSRMLR